MTARDRIVETADGVRTLFSDRYGQTYHSHHGALAEARHVFLEGTGTASRLAAGEPTRVLEVGFGTGLNFLLTARDAATNDTPLHYVALDHELLSPEVLQALDHGRALDAADLHRALVDWRASLGEVVTPGGYHFSPEEGVVLEVIVGEATSAALPQSTFDAVFLDAFSPRANPELWAPDFLVRLHEALRPGGILTTYSVSRAVRDSLAEAGFSVEKRPGPPQGKREMCFARR